MCGIAGIFSGKGAVREGSLKKMSHALAHRGPDAEGFFVNGDSTVGLAHRRLSIIDLSVQANQPFVSQCGRYVMVFNGEVYNHTALAEKLDRPMKTRSDTEVVLEAFAQWGLESVRELNGMFACCIYDKKLGRAYLFRDRLGIKPLYYHSGEGFAFSSELKGLLALPFIRESTALDLSGIDTFLHLGYLPEKRSLLRDIHKFPAGHYGIWEEGHGLRLTPYWKPENVILPKEKLVTDEKQAVDTLDHLIHESVKDRLMSDVPFGTFLSGGIDSSLVTAVASRHVHRLNTFSIGFEASHFDESPYARAVADHLGTEHHEFLLSVREAIPLLEEVLEVYDEPFADSSAAPTMLVSKFARERVKMVLTGDGGDELFHGYGSYGWAQRMEDPLIKAFRGPVRALLSTGGNRWKRAAHHFDKVPVPGRRSHIFSQEQYFFSRRELASLLKVSPSGGEFGHDPNLSRSLTAPESQALFDVGHYLKDDLLVKVDRASMKYSLEARVPLLDHRVVEYALNIDPKLKIKGKEQKYVLKQVLFNYVPPSLFDRPKWGFGIPLAQWMKGELHYLISDHLNKGTLDSLGIFDTSLVGGLVKRFSRGEDYLYNRLWVLILMVKWLKKMGFSADDLSARTLER